MKHYSKKFLYYRLAISILISLLYSFVFILSALSSSEDEESFQLQDYLIYIIAGFVVIYMFLAIYNIIFFKISTYEIKDNEIICKKGVLVRKKSFLEYDKIHAINKKQGIIQKAFGICVLTIDSGSANTAGNPEITIYETSEEVDKIMAFINEKQSKELVKDTSNHEEGNLYTYSKKVKFINVIFSVLSAAFIIFCLVILSLIAYNIIKNYEEITLEFSEIIIYGLIAIIIMLMVSFVGSLIFVFVGYYDFSIQIVGDTLNINYGLLVKNNNSFSLTRVKAIKVSQGLIKRIFGFATVRLEVIGYVAGDENNNNDTIGILIPLCKLDEVNNCLNKILPNYTFLPKQYNCKSFYSFISMHLFFGSIISIITLFISYIFASYLGRMDIFYIILIAYCCYVFLYLLILIPNSILSYNTNSINIDDEKITIYHGGLSKEIVTIKKENIIGIESVTTPLREKKNIYSYIIHFKTNSSSNTIKVANLDKNLKEKLESCMKY